MAYQTIEETRERYELGLSDEVKYPNGLITFLIKRAQMLVDQYLGQSLELDSVDRQDVINAIPTHRGGLHIQLKKRFIVSVTSVSIAYGYGYDSIDISPTCYQLNKELGYIDTSIGSTPRYMFDTESNLNYLATVDYKAGLTTLPDDFIEAFNAILLQVKEIYDTKHDEDAEATTVSNKITEYRTLNEWVKFKDDDRLYNDGKGVLDEWVEKILRKYRMPDFGIGVRF